MLFIAVSRALEANRSNEHSGAGPHVSLLLLLRWADGSLYYRLHIKCHTLRYEIYTLNQTNGRGFLRSNGLGPLHGRWNKRYTSTPIPTAFMSSKFDLIVRISMSPGKDSVVQRFFPGQQGPHGHLQWFYKTQPTSPCPVSWSIYETARCSLRRSNILARSLKPPPHGSIIALSATREEYFGGWAFKQFSDRFPRVSIANRVSRRVNRRRIQSVANKRQRCVNAFHVEALWQRYQINSFHFQQGSSLNLRRKDEIESSFV